jgi:hypothetical protein
MAASLHRSPDPLARRDVAALLERLVVHTSAAPVRLARIAEPALVLLDDPHLAVRARAAVAFDGLCAEVFHSQAYELALRYADALCRHDVNLDLQSARRWECLAALGREAEAEEAWAISRAMTTPDERAPRMHEGLHTDYPSYDVWRAFGELRIARAHMAAAAGRHLSHPLI